MKIYMNVQYAEKDAAKAGGAKWDAGAKKWYWLGEDALPATLERFRTSGAPSAKRSMRCTCCGQTGSTGDYPFSTAPGTGRCDDCV
jgi:hypothetical protein